MIRALIIELQLRKDEFSNEIIETIYFGGGTPSLLTVDDIQLLIDEVYKNFIVFENPEITLEANPDDLMSFRPRSRVFGMGRNLFESYRKTDINRLSIGIQSFFDEDLKAMNRAHNANEAKKCLEEATQHFDNITIDLIYGIPNMSNERWKQNLQLAFDFGVPHISSYALTIEPKTALENFIRKGKYPPISEELAEQHFNTLVTETEKAGFIQYEISNFGKDGFFSRHNTSYWQGKPYLGIGPSAHSFHKNQRSWNVSNNSKYIKAVLENKLPQEIEILSKEDRFNEYIMTGLRTIWGVSLEKIEQDFGLPVKEKLLKSAQKFIDKKLLVISSDFDDNQNRIEKLKTTQKGKFLVDGIASDLFILN